MTQVQERVPAAERIAVRCVDSDVHPVPKRGELIQYIPEPWRSKFFLEHKVGELIYYDAPTTHIPTRCAWTPSRPTASSRAATRIWRFGS
ncbi:amidohydrolase family domain protein [Mycobacterium xenopi 3993]|nr:amidohydrolase family domain protein [Mycobacterium xenopi 3993]